MIDLKELADFLDQFLHVEQFGDDLNGIYHPSSCAIARLGLALEPWDGLNEWAIAHSIDALFLHRPWMLDLNSWSSDIGILAYHLAFDEGLTLGFNPLLASVLEMTDIEVLGRKADRPIGMVGQVPLRSFEWYCDRLTTEFHGVDEVRSIVGEVSRITVVGAMTDALVREAANRGTDLYITGQLRKPAEEALQETGVGCIAVGHQRSEEWGLRSLAQILQERWPNLLIFRKYSSPKSVVR